MMVMLVNHLGEHKVINIKLQKKKPSDSEKKRQLYEISHQLLSFKNPIWSTQKAMFTLEWTAYIKKIIRGEITY